MTTRLFSALTTIAMLGAVGFAHAQPMDASGAKAPTGKAMPPASQEHYQAITGDRPTYPVAITDEYGFKYDSMGNRLDAQGHVIAPPETKPGAAVLK